MIKNIKPFLDLLGPTKSLITYKSTHIHFRSCSTASSSSPGSHGGHDHSSPLTTASRASHYRRSTLPSGIPLSKILTNSFPLPIQESFKDFLNRHQIDQFQKNLLSTLPFYPLADSQNRKLEFVKTVIDDEGNYINEFCIYPQDMENKLEECNHLVLMHGYGAGLGFYLRNFEDISEYGCSEQLDPSKKWCIHAIDLLGYGLSSRPKFPYHLDDLDELKKWFTDSLHTWFTKRNLPLDKTLVLAHSLGGYIAAHTNMQYPDLFKKLILVSPLLISKPDPEPVIPQWFKLLWERNISPFVLVRYSGPLGSFFVSGWSSRRFGKLPEREQSLLHKYVYGIFNARGSGEYILNYVLLPGGVPRVPLIDSIHKISCDLTWLYGEDDWMDLHGGKRASDIVNEKTSYNSSYKIIPRSGHHIYLDNHKEFNRTIIDEMRLFAGDDKKMN